MRHFGTDDLAADREPGPASYLEFLRVPAMSAGLYTLAAGEPDPQTPHSEDEVYVVVEGRASFTAADATIRVGVGSVIFVPAHEDHHFHDVTEDLKVLVFFAPAES